MAQTSAEVPKEILFGCYPIMNKLPQLVKRFKKTSIKISKIKKINRILGYGKIEIN